MQASKHTLRYLKGTKDLGSRYTRDQDRLSARDKKLNTLYALSDSDFAGCKDTAKSTSGYMILLNGGVVAYYSGRQSTEALCTAMAETIALAKLVDNINTCVQYYMIYNVIKNMKLQFKLCVCGLIIQPLLQ